MTGRSKSDLDGNSNLKTYFWGYDIFGYLLPGLLVLMASMKMSDNLYYHLGKYIQTAESSIGFELFSLLVFGIIAYLVGHIVAGISSWLLERIIVRNIVGYPSERLFSKNDEPGKLSKVLMPGYFRPYTDSFRDALMKCFTDDAEDYHDKFWIAFVEVSNNAPVTYRRLTHFLELYGFSRNISMALIIIALLPFLNFSGFWFDFHPLIIDRWLWVLLFLSLAYIMFVNYLKLLRRLNDELYRAYYVLKSKSHNEL